MAFESDFTVIPLEQAHDLAVQMKERGARFIQVHAVNCEGSCDLYYSYMEDGAVHNYKVVGITPDMPVQSITDVFLAAFVFENEARELFGIDMRDVAIDFGGHMYDLAETAPMTYISPEQKAAREKARKAAAAKAAKEAEAAATPAAAASPKAKPAAVAQADLEAKLAGMDPEKAAKVRAAMAAKAAREAAAREGKGE